MLLAGFLPNWARQANLSKIDKNDFRSIRMILENKNIDMRLFLSVGQDGTVISTAITTIKIQILVHHEGEIWC